MSHWQKIWKQRNSRRGYYSRRLRKGKSKLFAKGTVLVFISLICFSIFTVGLFAYYAKDLPHPDRVVRREGFSTKIYDRNGELLYDIFTNERRTPVELEEVPEHLKNATIAIEDKNFYKHSGFDLFGLFRGLSRIFSKGRAEGGSTLTQQLVKNVLLTPQRTITRKLKEFILAVQIEGRYS